jgi:polyhydroxyalkanoate synthesis regulator phasin
MDEPASRGVRDSLERLLLAALGAFSLTADRIDELADRLAERGGITRDEARETIQEVAFRWRGDVLRIGERTGSSLEGLFRELGLVTGKDVDELELRLAQLEHRLRLLESGPRALPTPPASAEIGT